MSSLPATRPPANRKPPAPLQPVAVVGRLLTGLGERLPELLEGNAILEIESEERLEPYWCGLIIDPTTGKISGVKLQRFGCGARYELPATLDDCSCPDAIYRSERPGGCKHQEALRQALLSVANGIKTAPLSRPNHRVERDEATQPPAA